MMLSFGNPLKRKWLEKEEHIELIASENYASQRVLQAKGFCINK
ncbi:MAG: hypothetical protein Ct9H90mP6_10830 [Gammaproteobacteria bacterium]|nr:MAG: hypothetical protein Ct9H90mP6_10830 [Gammaproteobacteria bacterium]